MKVGDKVVVLTSQGLFRGVFHIERETKLHWIVKGYKYRKTDLTAPGDAWFCDRIEPLTQKHLDDIKKLKLSIKLGAIRWGELDLETLEKVFAIVCGMTETKENKQ